MSNDKLTTEELADQVAKLTKRVEQLEAQLAAVPVPEEDLAIIAATAAAYLGYSGSVKAIHYAAKSPFASA